MNIGELFIELGFKADTMKLKEFMRAIGELNMSSIAGAVGLGSLYEATKKIMDVADQAAMNIFGYTQVTGLSGKEMQQFSNYAEQMGVSAQDAQGSLKSLQMAMFNVQLGRGNPEPFILTGIDVNEKNPVNTLEQLQKFIQSHDMLDPFNRMLVSEMGISESMLNVLKSSKDIRDAMSGQVFLNEEQYAQTLKYHQEVTKLGQTWKFVLATIGNDISPALDGILKIVTFIVTHANVLKAIFFAIAIAALILGGPIGLVATVIAGIAIASGLIVHYWEKIGTFITSFFKPLKDLLGLMKEVSLSPMSGFNLPKVNPGQLGLSSGATTNQNSIGDIILNITGAMNPIHVAELAAKEIQKVITDRFYSEQTQKI